MERLKIVVVSGVLSVVLAASAVIVPAGDANKISELNEMLRATDNGSIYQSE